MTKKDARVIREWMLALAAVIGGCAVEGPPAGMDHRSPSTSPLEAVLQIKRIVDEGALVHDDLLTQEELASRFGGTVTITLRTSTGATHEAHVVGYREVADPFSKYGVPNGMSIDLYKYPDKNGLFICFVSAQFRGFPAGLDFDHVVERLGPGWRRDTQAETRKFFAVTSEPFNPPFPKSTARMGNAMIVYGEGNRALNLEFAADGNLFSVTRWRLPCQ